MVMEPWVFHELDAAQLGDQRLTQRAIKLVNAFSKNPGGSIPQALGGDADEVKDAYRFFHNPRITPTGLLHAHEAATRKRAQDAADDWSLVATTVVILTSRCIRRPGALAPSMPRRPRD